MAQKEITSESLGLLPLSKCELLTAPRLLAYYKKHRWFRWRWVCDCCGEAISESDRMNTSVANKYLDAVKKILDTKEHVEK